MKEGNGRLRWVCWWTLYLLDQFSALSTQMNVSTKIGIKHDLDMKDLLKECMLELDHSAMALPIILQFIPKQLLLVHHRSIHDKLVRYLTASIPADIKQQQIATSSSILSNVFRSSTSTSVSPISATELEGSPQRAFFTVVNLSANYNIDQLSNIIAFS